MYILGLNAFHADSSAAIFKDGIMIAATEEERFTRVKHWAGFPVQAIRFCLKEACSCALNNTTVNLLFMKFSNTSTDPIRLSL